MSRNPTLVRARELVHRDTAAPLAKFVGVALPNLPVEEAQPSLLNAPWRLRTSAKKA